MERHGTPDCRPRGFESTPAQSAPGYWDIFTCTCKHGGQWANYWRDLLIEFPAGGYINISEQFTNGTTGCTKQAIAFVVNIDRCNITSYLHLTEVIVALFICNYTAAGGGGLVEKLSLSNWLTRPERILLVKVLRKYLMKVAFM